MNEINKTLYIPLYGKSYVSKKGIILNDVMAEKIWSKSGFTLNGRSKSKWLAYYMGMRSRVFDDWLRERMSKSTDAVVIHIGCGLDSRVERVGCCGHLWYDVDFPEVIDERRRHFSESDGYRMLSSDATADGWIDAIPTNREAIVIMEGVSMYIEPSELSALLSRLSFKFESLSLLVDCYTSFAARASKIKNPINDVGVTTVYGIDEPKSLEISGVSFLMEHKITPMHLIDEISGSERFLFKALYGGKIARRLYRLYEFKK